MKLFVIEPPQFTRAHLAKEIESKLTKKGVPQGGSLALDILVGVQLKLESKVDQLTHATGNQSPLDQSYFPFFYNDPRWDSYHLRFACAYTVMPAAIWIEKYGRLDSGIVVRVSTLQNHREPKIAYIGSVSLER